MRLNWLALVGGGALAGCTNDAAVIETFGPEPTTDAMDDGGTTDAPDDGDGMLDGTSQTSSDPGPVEPECGNDIIDGQDVCDGTELGGTSCQSLGFERGELACTPNCGGYDLSDCGFFECGNGKEEGEEDCDGTVGDKTCVSVGFDNGTLFCTMECEYNIANCGICGNADIEPAEDCDTEKALETTCQNLGFMTGTLQCGDDCLFDTSGCSTCGNDIQEGNEDCDGDDVPGKTCAGEGFDSGTLGCLANCDYDFGACGTCGNALVDGDEACDGNAFGGESCVSQGFDSGGLTCNATCDTIGTANCGMCGNAVIDGSEACDGALLGGQTCAALGLLGGELACSPTTCNYDYTGCDLQGIPFGSDGFYQGLSLTPGILPCDEISGTGTDLGLGDDTSAVVPLGFNFPFYGMPFTQVTVSSNGTLNFNDSSAPGLSNACFPAASENRIIGVFWDDLDPPDGVGGGVRHQTFGSAGNMRFVVQWDAPHFSGDNNDIIRVQATLHEAGNIDVCYVDTLSLANAGNNGAEATAGIGFDAVNSVQYSCNTPDLVNGLLLMYLPI